MAAGCQMPGAAIRLDVVIVGGGIAGLQTALVAGRSGIKVLLIEQHAPWGGRAQIDED